MIPIYIFTLHMHNSYLLVYFCRLLYHVLFANVIFLCYVWQFLAKFPLYKNLLTSSLLNIWFNAALSSRTTSRLDVIQSYLNFQKQNSIEITDRKIPFKLHLYDLQESAPKHRYKFLQKWFITNPDGNKKCIKNTIIIYIAIWKL